MLYIDILTPCLQEVLTGEIVETEVVRIRRTSFLQKFNKKNGWYTSWSKLAKDNEIYSLVIKGTVDIQGLVANEQLERHYVDNFDAIRIHMLHPYQILITEDAGKRIKEAYTYEWKDDEL